MQINSAYTTPYAPPSVKSYHKDVETRQGDKTPANQDTVSISVEARKLAESDLTVDSKLASDGLDKYRQNKTNENMSFIEKIQQALMDRRIGLDREKIDEINEKMKEIMNDKSIPAELKAEMLEQLEQEKLAEFEKSAEKTTQQAKKEAEQPEK